MSVESNIFCESSVIRPLQIQNSRLSDKIFHVMDHFQPIAVFFTKIQNLQISKSRCLSVSVYLCYVRSGVYLCFCCCETLISSIIKKEFPLRHTSSITLPYLCFSAGTFPKIKNNWFTQYIFFRYVKIYRKKEWRYVTLIPYCNTVSVELV